MSSAKRPRSVSPVDGSLLAQHKNPPSPMRSRINTPEIGTLCLTAPDIGNPGEQAGSDNADSRATESVLPNQQGKGEKPNSGEKEGKGSRTCFRVQNIPKTWTLDVFLGHLLSMFPSFEVDGDQVSLYPACCDSEANTALLNLTSIPEGFDREGTLTIRHDGGKSTDLEIDKHFYGLTPMGSPPDDKDIIVDIVAVTGLAGHAYGSWRSRESHRMWLADFLPKKIKNARIMSYGYNSNLVNGTNNMRLPNYRQEFINILENARSSSKEKLRPLIFIGHSMGGLLIIQTLIYAKIIHDHHKHILESTIGLFLFGTPHQGLEVTAILEMIDDTGSSRGNLVQDLAQDSYQLVDQREHMANLWGNKLPNIFSFYETEDTQTVGKNKDGVYGRAGVKKKMVTENSAQLFWQSELRIPVPSNHTDMVKFKSSSDPTYQTVVRYIRECLDGLGSALDLQLTKELATCLQALNPRDNTFDYQAYRDNILRKRQEGTCEWIQKTSKYEAWLNSDSGASILWLHGDPGSGKSTISAFLSTTLPISVAYSFFDDKDEKLRNASSMLRTLLVQVLNRYPKVFEHFQEEDQYKLHKEKTSWTYEMLWRVYRRIATDENMEQICLIIDAMDECEEPSRSDFLDRLAGVYTSPHVKRSVKILITSRPHVMFDRWKQSPDVHMLELAGDLLAGDIKNYLDTKVKDLAMQKRLSPELENDIRQTLLSGANGSFLWVSLVLNQLKTLKSTSNNRILLELKRLPKDIREVYRRILNSVDRDYEIEAREALRWIVYARRPLGLNELAVAIVIRPEHRSMASIKDDIEQDMRKFLVSIFGPLLRIHDDDTVHLVHQSAKDFLLNSDSRDEDTCTRLRPTTDSNDLLATACLTFLNFIDFEDEIKFIAENFDFPGATNLGYDQKSLLRRKLNDYFTATEDNHPFLNYSAAQWTFHAQLEKNEAPTRSLIGAFLNLARCPNRIRYAHCSLVTKQSTSRLYSNAPIYGITTASIVTITAYFEAFGCNTQLPIDEPLQDRSHGNRIAPCLTKELLLVKEFNVNEHCGWYYLSGPLQVAALRGHETLLRLLINNGAQDNNGAQEWESSSTSALILASDGGYGAMVRLLIDNGADVNSLNEYHGTALTVASNGGHEAVVRLLIDNGAVVDAPGGYQGTALIAASDGGYEAVVRLLIDNGADVNAPGGYYGTALIAASDGGYEAVVRLLIDNGAVVDTPNNYNGTALAAASRGGHEAVVRLLIDKGADVNAPGGYYGTALHSASMGKHKSVVQLLVENGAAVIPPPA